MSARAAKAATQTIPILFIGGPDPVGEGLVASINRPGGNVTGVALQTAELMPKRLQLLDELVPHAATIALLVNPIRSLELDVDARLLEAATRAAGQKMVLLNASVESELEPAFASAVRQRADALLVSASAFFTDRRVQLVTLAARHALPAAYPFREYADAGGLMSYGPSIADVYRLIGRYASRILKGDKPADLPVQLPTKFELILNLKTAKALGLDVPGTLLARAEELIE
jgi:putative tryptophan/tyrosine transport system substrate-binding protein